MFDIGFWELGLIGVVALLVIGPERLPKVAHTAGLWFGRMRRFVSSVKADIDREVKGEELKRVLEQHKQSSGLHDILEETKGAVEALEATRTTFNEQIDSGDEAVPIMDPVPESTSKGSASEGNHDK